ncbi:hypothetical protein C7S16_2818 [Burkholderia thailandensis]|uniref:Uncharacterized protein n=1 Tax=Burkholderia thailandensis TaxID=57975 RepID=A0AAW9D3I6_BURTH|nr:hypothetical protein [Burkholderia thailandensis]MDW9255219.1 hypothetical protein [Burkholderia thailandensis]
MSYELKNDDVDQEGLRIAARKERAKTEREGGLQPGSAPFPRRRRDARRLSGVRADARGGRTRQPAGAERAWRLLSDRLRREWLWRARGR